MHLLRLLVLPVGSACFFGGTAVRPRQQPHAENWPAVPIMVATSPSEKAASVAASEVVPPLLPEEATAKWEVHKFGGASLADAGLYVTCGQLLLAEAQRALAEKGACAPTMAIVSAKQGVTDELIGVVEAARTNYAKSEVLLRGVAVAQLEVVKEIADEERSAVVEARLAADVNDILMCLRAVTLIKTVPPTTMELVTGYGEVWSAMTMHAYLASQGAPTAWLDAREVLTVENPGGTAGLGDKGSSNTAGVEPLWSVTSSNVRAWWEAESALAVVDYQSAAPVVIVTGFVASTVEGTPTTLKRSGSDYSATIFARLMGASKITMWKYALRKFASGSPRVSPYAPPNSQVVPSWQECRRRVHGRPAARARGLPDRVAQVR